MEIKDLVKISKALKLLYVEDDAEIRKNTLQMLEVFFVDITVAVDGQDGFAQYEEKKFDIIMSDINMPKLNGLELLKKIRAKDEDIVFLVFSAHNDNEYLLESIEHNVDAYILKPLDRTPFIKVLSKVVEKIHLKNEIENYKFNLEDEVKRKTKELRTKLYFDELTGLHNRYSFFEDLNKREIPIVFLVDINNFQVINEIYGLSTGSLVLKKFAEFLNEFTQNSSYKIYHLSADEFAVIDHVNYIDTDKYESAIENFFKALNNFKIDLENNTISIEITIGLSTIKENTYETAKIALEHAKSSKNEYVAYSSKLDKKEEEQNILDCKEKIKYSLANNLVTAVYQPIVDKDRNIVKSETLMRLKDKNTKKLISPYFFLDIAIKTGLYNSLSSHIIFEALHLLKTSQHTLSFNFTYSDIKNTSFLNEIEVFFKTAVNLGKRAIFEITESESIENYDDVKEFIKRFRHYGIQFAIDDFGSGFSNFEYILEIEPDYLKIDGSLIKNINTDEKAHSLVKAIVQFSHELGIKVIAEYVHSEVIFEILKKLNVDEYQGFYFYEPQEKVPKKRK